MGAVGVAAALFAWTAAAFVYWSHPSRPQHRRLALVLFFEGVAVGAGTGLMYMTVAERDSYGWQALATLSTLILPPLYLWFVSSLDSPLVTSLKGRLAQRILILLILAAGSLWFLFPSKFIEPRLEPTWYATWDSTAGPWQPWRLAASIAVYSFALLVAFSNYARAPRNTLVRERAGAYALAFGTRDALLGLTYLLRAPALAGLFSDDRGLETATFLTRPFITILFIALVAYGILKTHLFDIEVKIRWTIRRGTLAAVFIAVFFVVAEVGEEFLSKQLGWWMGGLAAGLLLFAISPLQRFASRVAEAAIPNAKSMGELAPDERRTIYREQARLAWADGELRREERLFLDHLRARLEISGPDARRLESEVAP